MNPPSEKKLSKLSPSILKYGIPRQLIRDYDGKKYDGHRDECERCGGRHLQRIGFEDRAYATIIQPSGFYDVMVHLQKVRCVQCHHVMVCDDNQLFYPKCRYGRGIVDACLFLASSNPYNRVERIMQEYGVQVDIQTIRRYAIRFGKKAAGYAPLKFMGQNVELGANLVKIIFGKDDVKELSKDHDDDDNQRSEKEKDGAMKKKKKKTDAVVDETYPSVKGSKKAHREDNRVRKSVGEKTERFGSSFTLASSYLHNLHLFASIICTLAPFSSILAEALVQPLKGCAYILADGSYCYNGLVDERCLWHYMKNFFNKMDYGLIRMKTKQMLPQLISEHMRYVYSIAKEEYVKYLMEKYPEFIRTMKDGSKLFLGATTTNAMEGGNWRVKYELRVPYLLPESVFARSMLIELGDSLYTFRHGHPEESFGHRNGVFSYSRIMGMTNDEVTIGEDVGPPVVDLPLITATAG